ncbi:hypothetical protein H0H93_002437, partial [Arthromyces matolae]
MSTAAFADARNPQLYLGCPSGAEPSKVLRGFEEAYLGRSTETEANAPEDPVIDPGGFLVLFRHRMPDIGADLDVTMAISPR